jgi:hypothetical protein
MESEERANESRMLRMARFEDDYAIHVCAFFNGIMLAIVTALSGMEPNDINALLQYAIAQARPAFDASMESTDLDMEARATVRERMDAVEARLMSLYVVDDSTRVLRDTIQGMAAHNILRILK